MTVLFTETALLPTGWASNVRIEVTPEGYIAACTPGGDPAGAEHIAGTIIPGMPNLHSHAFQRAMVGLSERAAGGTDTFWTWREVMYGFANRVGPEDLQAIAAQLYVEMLRAGYTAVAEFHYIHHDRDGTPYADRAELSERVIAAAAATGIGMTLLPVLYQSAGFDGRPAGAAQRRFVNHEDDLLAMVAALRQRHAGDKQFRVGLAPHSLRAVPEAAFRAAIRAATAIDRDMPLHIHVAEQVREVEECLAATGKRPVELLLERIGPEASWCLVHATHMTEAETRAVAASPGIVAGLCPSTEANLGDGLFAFPDYIAVKGAWGIGSDSHVSVDPREELRWLEYGQRLVARRRNVVNSGAAGSPGRLLWTAATEGGARACGRALGRLEPGSRADLVVLDSKAPALYGKQGDALLDAAIFAGAANPVRHVMVGGRWVVRDFVHIAEERIEADFRAAIDRLTAEL